MPIEFRAQREGMALLPVTAGDLAILAQIPEGVPFRTRLYKDRSKKHHRRFFGAIKCAFENWPEGYEEFQPENAKHLRKWLECEAGHRDFTDFHLAEADDPKQFVEGIIKMAKGAGGEKESIFPRVKGRTVRVYWARSIAWDELDQDEFARLANPIESMIEQIVGVSVDELFLQSEMMSTEESK